MNFKKRFPDQHVGFQMAPMVDIMFLLLIFFMVAALFSEWETKVGITVPTADTGVRAERSLGEVIINIDEQGEISVNDVAMDPDRLQSLLAQVADQFRGQPVIIRADAKAEHEDVVEVLDICRKVDIWNVAFAALPSRRAG